MSSKHYTYALLLLFFFYLQYFKSVVEGLYPFLRTASPEAVLALAPAASTPVRRDGDGEEEQPSVQVVAEYGGGLGAPLSLTEFSEDLNQLDAIIDGGRSEPGLFESLPEGKVDSTVEDPQPAPVNADAMVPEAGSSSVGPKVPRGGKGSRKRRRRDSDESPRSSSPSRKSARAEGTTTPPERSAEEIPTPPERSAEVIVISPRRSTRVTRTPDRLVIQGPASPRVSPRRRPRRRPAGNHGSVQQGAPTPQAPAAPVDPETQALAARVMTGLPRQLTVPFIDRLTSDLYTAHENINALATINRHIIQHGVNKKHARHQQVSFQTVKDQGNLAVIQNQWVHNSFKRFLPQYEALYQNDNN